MLETSTILSKHFLLLMVIVTVNGFVINNQSSFNSTTIESMATTIVDPSELNATKEFTNLSDSWTIGNTTLFSELDTTNISLDTITATSTSLKVNKTARNLNVTYINGQSLASIGEESASLPDSISHLFKFNHTISNVNDTLVYDPLMSTSTPLGAAALTPKSNLTTTTRFNSQVSNSNNLNDSVISGQPVILTRLTSRLLSTTKRSTTVKPTTASIDFYEVLKVNSSSDSMINKPFTTLTPHTIAQTATTTPKPTPTTASVYYYEVLKVNNSNDALTNSQITTLTPMVTTKATTIMPNKISVAVTTIPPTLNVSTSVENAGDTLIDSHVTTTSKSTTKLPSTTTSRPTSVKPSRKAGKSNLRNRLMLNSRPYQPTNDQPVVYDEPVTMVDVVYDDMVPAFDIGEVLPIVTSTKVAMPSFYNPTPPPWLAKELKLAETTEQSTTTKKLFLITVPPLDGETTISDELIDHNSENSNHDGIIPVEATSAIIISGIIGGCAIAFFSIVMALCIWRQHKSRRPIYPPNRPMLPTTSLTSINSQKSVGLFQR
ncbi:hypothetical protein CHUAL_009182 [Chamberlinius hualienensis]